MKKLTLSGFAAFLLCVGTAVAASNDALLELLVKKGVLTEAEASAVQEELDSERPVVVTAKSKAVENIKLTGRIHMQYDNIDNDNDGDDADRDRFSFRRLYFGAEAKLAEDFYGKLIGNFGGEDGDVVLDKAVVGWKYHPKAEFEAGYTKVPFGFYETTSSSKIKTVERSIANRTFVESDGFRLGGRHTGLFAEGDLGGGLSYGAAVVTSSASNDRDDKSNAEKDGLGFFGRLQWESADSDAGQVLVGVDAAFMQNGSEYADKGSSKSGEGDSRAFGIHGNYELGGFNVSAEALFGTIKDQMVAGEDIDVFGFTVTPSYAINENWEIVAAYSVVDSDGGNLLDVDDLVRRSGVDSTTYDEGESFYVGFNRYILGNDIKVSGGYEFGSFEKAGGEDVDFDALRLRLQLLF